ncbi:hypothetical protein BaRGS_00008973 [Batillaria attramentaria]|uniref:Major facilitator superfamily (MFS) profile domain-containing protein n=1 Tax=Batillaria attramentaria TaxID=370345 RepID=A0ABD0LKN7_9CAEN
MGRDRGEQSPEELKKKAQERAEAEATKDADALPDGGWGWMVVLGSLVCNIVVDGVCYSFGVFKEQYMLEFNASNEQTGWVGSLLAGCYLTIGPVVSVLAEKYGCRKVTIAGSVVSAVGFILSTQATSIEMLIVTYGVIGGVGFGMIYLPAIVTVGHWFDKKRAFATGLAVCGTGIGTFIFAPLSQKLIGEFGWRGAHLILAGIVLNCAVCGAIFRPLDKVKPRKECYQSQVEIQRGAIMKALIEEKKRQRTISNGSLDNCIITRDNRLIKIDPALLECKRNNSFIARFKRSLGFSSQSLNKSKSSLAGGIPSIVIDAVNEAHKENNSAKMSPIYRPNGKQPPGSPPSRTIDPKSDSPKSSASEDSGVCADGQKLASDSISLDDLLLRLQQEEPKAVNHTDASSFHSVNNPVIFTGNSKHHALEGSIISVQVLPNFGKHEAGSFPNIRHRGSLRSLSDGSYTNHAVSQSSFVSRSLLSIPQNVSQCSIESVASQVRRENQPMYIKLLYVTRDMFEFNLLRNPLFFLLVVASVLTLLAFFIPFFYLTMKAAEIGRDENEGVFLLSIIGITNTIGRVISGWIADRPWTNVLHLNNGALMLAGGATILCAFVESYPLLCIYAAGFGFCIAVFVSLRSVLLVELLGLDLLTKSFGILILFQGIATMVGAPIAGRLLDTTGSVKGCFIMAGVLLMVSGLLGLPLKCLKKRQTKDIPPLLPEEMPITETLKIENVGSATV